MQERNGANGDVSLVQIGDTEQSVTIDVANIARGSVDNGYKIVEIYNDASRGRRGDIDGILKILDIDIDGLAVIYRYLGNVLSKNSGSRGRDKRYELGQIKLVYDQLEPLFSENDMSQAPEKGGRRTIVNTGKKQSGGFDPFD